VTKQSLANKGEKQHWPASQHFKDKERGGEERKLTHRGKRVGDWVFVGESDAQAVSSRR